MNGPSLQRSTLLQAAGILATALVCAVESRITGSLYLLGFVGFVPWFLALDRVASLRGALVSGLAMVASFVIAVFLWFGDAMAEYSAAQAALGFVALVLAAPILQPQVPVFAVARFAARRTLPLPAAILAGAFAWTATEWVFPKLLADNLAHGLYPSDVLRQCAAFAGTSGMTFALVLVNECVAAAVSRASRGGSGASSAAAPPLAAAAAVVLAMVAYGNHRLDVVAAAGRDAAASGEAPVRLALVQANIAGYERLRREMGAYEAVRLVLDTHYALSRLAVAERGADAVVWPETVFPTTFGVPKNDTGAELDREIVDFASALGRPLVFGSYDRDEGGEYNSAVFLRPSAPGAAPDYDVYRKTRLFLFTEYLPWWMDHAWVRALVPWAGAWKPGDGARVLPLALADGRRVPVAPLVCLDDVDPGLAIDGARLGARALLTMSNDSWFAGDGGGAYLHLVVAAFRSVETGLPQMRVTNNGISVVVSAAGEILESAAVGERRVLVASVPAAVAPTLMVAWGDWFGRFSTAAMLALFVAGLVFRRNRGDKAPRPG